MSSPPPPDAAPSGSSGSAPETGPRRILLARDHVALQPEEPAIAAWRTGGTRALTEHVLALVGPHPGRPGIIAVDGRSGAGKTTITSRLVAAIPGAQVLRIDDLDWNEPLFEWDHLLVAALTDLRRDGALALIPPAWRSHGRDGSLTITTGAPLVIVEGTGSGMRAVADLVDLHIWVQTDDDVAQKRGIARDIREGTNGDANESVQFWHRWMSHERPFLAADRPWERARLIVSGEALPGLADGEVAWAEGPLLESRRDFGPDSSRRSNA